MVSLKHVGKIRNTGKRCVIVFREIYDEQGHVIDEKNCLVFETESLPDSEHQDLMRIIESENAQSTGDVFNVLARERLATGTPALNWLVQTNRLRKFPTNNVDLTPDGNTVIGLDKLNKIVKLQKAGVSEAEINNMLRDDTDLPPRQVTDIVNDQMEEVDVVETQPGEDVLDDTKLAKSLLSQAETFTKQAAELKEQAYALDSSLKPKTRKTRTRKPANKKEQ